MFHIIVPNLVVITLNVAYHKALYRTHFFFFVYVNDLAFACKQARPVLLADRSRVNISSIDVDNVQQVKNESTKIYIHGLEKMSF